MRRLILLIGWLCAGSLYAEDLAVTQTTSVRCNVESESYQWTVVGPRGQVGFLEEDSGRTIIFASTNEWRIVVCTASGKQITVKVNGGDPNAPVVIDQPEVPEVTDPTEVEHLVIITDPLNQSANQSQALLLIQQHFGRGPPTYTELAKGTKGPDGEPSAKVKQYLDRIPEGKGYPYYFGVDGKGKIATHGEVEDAEAEGSAGKVIEELEKGNEGAKDK